MRKNPKRISIFLLLLILAHAILTPTSVLSDVLPRLLIEKSSEGIRLSWPPSGFSDYQLLEFSDDLETWNTQQIAHAATSTVYTLRNQSWERGFFRIKRLNRDALLDTFRHTWLYTLDVHQSSFRKQPLDLPDWETLRQAHQQEGDLPDWITRQVLGPSSVGNFEVIRYDFKPANPTKTVIITGSMHGIEWPSTDILLRMFQTIAEKGDEHPAFTYLRNEVHFVVIPILNPWGYFYNDRRCRETAPIPVQWERTGTTATITIDTDRFPDTNGRFGANDYIRTNISGKVVVSIQNASDTTTLPTKGYKIEQTVDSLRFTVLCNDQGTTSGTAEMYVLTDMNRQFDINNWEGFSHLTWNDANGVPYANKGTRPYALLETQYLRDILHTHSNAVAYLDFHTGPPYPYSAYYGANDDFDRQPLDLIIHFLDPPTNEILIGANALPSGNSYAAQQFGMQSFTPETGGTDANKTFEWWINLLIAYSLLY